MIHNNFNRRGGKIPTPIQLETESHVVLVLSQFTIRLKQLLRLCLAIFAISQAPLQVKVKVKAHTQMNQMPHKSYFPLIFFSFFSIMNVVPTSASLPYTVPSMVGVGVQLFQWKFVDIARECTDFLGPNGFSYVQTSPVQEHRSNQQGDNEKYPWWLAYQPLGYNIGNRLGTEQEFKDMVSTCKAANVKVVVDIVLNHMAGQGSSGTSGFGSTRGWSSKPFEESFPDPGYSSVHFHDKFCNGDISNYNALDDSIYNCRLSSLIDVDTGRSYVRKTMADFLNKLLSYGVYGFRADAAKYISWPDWNATLSQLKADSPIYFGGEITGPFGDNTYRNYEYFGK
jgi:alpha-amylase